MPYVPSEKTVPPAEDRKILDAVVRPLADEAASRITNNMSLVKVYRDIFMKVSGQLDNLLLGNHIHGGPEASVAQAIYGLNNKYGYEGAQMEKSGHCYFGPWYNRPLHQDILGGEIVVRRKPAAESKK